MRHALVAVLAALATTLTACASSQAEPSQAAQFREFYESLSAGAPIEDARDLGVSDAQAEILERAAERGEISLSDLREAIDSTFACFEEHGIRHSSKQHKSYMGQEQITYSYSAPPGVDENDPVWLALADECMSTNSGMIEMLYQMQPSGVLAQEQWFAENLRDEVAECLARYGVTAPEGADSNWYSRAVTDLAQPTGGGVDECETLLSLGLYGS